MILSRSPVSQNCRVLLFICAMGFAITVGSMDQALAQATNLMQVQSNVSKQIVFIPKLIATIAYVIAAFFASTGLLKLKDWIHDPDKNPLNGALFRLIVASLLIVFPHVMIIANTTFFGSDGNGASQKVNISVPMQSLTSFEKAQ